MDCLFLLAAQHAKLNMAKMQQLTFIRAGQFEWHDVEKPRISGSGEAIVRPLAVTRCDLDLYIARGDYPTHESFAFGHEIAGEVIEIGDKVTTVKPGDRIIVPFQISCGTCDMCNRGFTNACTSVPAYSAYGLALSSGKEWGGGLSDYVHVPYADSMLVKIPNGLSLTAAAAMSDNGIDGYRAVAQPLEQRPRANVLIVGGLAQSVGLFAVQTAVAMGAKKVVYCDFDEARLLAARGLGADARKVEYTSNLPPQEQFPIVVDVSALANGMAFALRSTAPCGHCTSVSAPMDQGDPLPLRQMYMKGATLDISKVHARGQLDQALNCISCGGLDPDLVISRQLSFQDAADAMADGDIKTVFIREES